MSVFVSLQVCLCLCKDTHTHTHTHTHRQTHTRQVYSWCRLAAGANGRPCQVGKKNRGKKRWPSCEHPLSHSYLCSYVCSYVCLESVRFPTLPLSPSHAHYSCISCCLPQVPKHINGSCFLSFFHSQHLPLSPSHAHTFITCCRLVLPGVAAGADARPCDICTHFITNNPVQVFTSQYIKMTLLRALVITFICMYVCMLW